MPQGPASRTLSTPSEFSTLLCAEVSPATTRCSCSSQAAWLISLWAWHVHTVVGTGALPALTRQLGAASQPDSSALQVWSHPRWSGS